MRVLVIDDDDGVRGSLRRALTLDGWEVVLAVDGAEGLNLISTQVPDVVILDVGMPVLDGLEVCRRVRRAGNRVPVLILTARESVPDRIAGLDAGADDYLPKPFDLGELNARLRALVRRNVEGSDGRRMRFAELELVPDERVVRVSGRMVNLTRTEFALLELFMLNPRRVLPSELIYDRVWGYDFGPGGNALRVYMGYLRRKLENGGGRRLLHTVHGVGYVLREPPEGSSPPPGRPG